MWINVIEDESNLNFLMVKYLEEEGYKVRSFLTGEEARKFMSEPVDLWVIDIMLPDTNGFSLFNEIKKVHPEVYTIFISARNQDIDRVAGLELGCDDYIPKPFMVRELIIKVNNIMKKNKEQKEYKIIGSYKIDLRRHRIMKENEIIEVSTKEYDLLLYLLSNKAVVLSRDQILDNVWGFDYYGADRVVDDTIRRIRKKIEGLQIKTIYGQGYCFEGIDEYEG